MALGATQQRQVVQQAAHKYGVEPRILWGLYGTETAFGHNVSRSSAGAVGPFQFLPSTAKGRGVNPYDFRSSAFGAAKFLSEFKGRGLAGMLSAYNAGPGGSLQPAYVAAVLKNAHDWKGAPAGEAPSRGEGHPTGEGEPAEEQAPPANLAVLQSLLAQQHTSSVEGQSPAQPTEPRQFDTPKAPAPIQPKEQSNLSSLLANIEAASPEQAERPGADPEAAAKGGGLPKTLSGAPGGRAVQFGVEKLGKYAESSGSNLGPELNKLESQFGFTGEPWCAIFATTAASRGGAAHTVRTASVAQINEWAAQGSHGYQKGLGSSANAQPGDLLTFGSQHVALVKERKGGTIVTIEGNANGSGGVTQRTRRVGEGRVARPRYR